MATFVLHAQGIEKRMYYDAEETVLKEVFFLEDTINNLLNGSYISYYLSGNMKSQGEYAYNRATGDWVYYFENGNIRNTGSFHRGRTFGIWTYYYENGNIRSEGILVDNKRGGEWIFYYEDGGVKSNGQYVGEQREGDWKFYYEGGILKAETNFHMGEGIYSEYYISGQLKMNGLNRAGKSDSVWVYYFETGEEMAEGYYDEGLKTGTWKYYFKSGEISAQGGYEEGQTIGNWIYYHENGAKSAEGLQTNSRKDGYWKMFYETGEMKGVGEFDEGTGEYNEYYISGKLKVNGHFQDDLNDGHWTYFDEEGHIEGEADFTNGVGEYMGYYHGGEVKMTGQISGGRRVGEWTLYKKTGEIAGKYHPVYHEEDPIFLTEQDMTDGASRSEYEKPDYKYKKRKSRYFSPVVNEYKGVIFGTNPLLMIAGGLPLAVEYYRQERLGYEALLTYYRNPFFSSLEEVNLNEVFTEGAGLRLRQKFYQRDQRYGMVYFAQGAGVEYRKHLSRVDNTGASSDGPTISMDETRINYGLSVGNRWLRHPGNAGVSVDAYLGLGVGYRFLNSNYSDTGNDHIFSDLPEEGFYAPIFFGVNIGYLGFKKYKQSPVR